MIGNSMKIKLLNHLLCFATCALLCTCSKDKLSPLEQLPPITSRGANTFGCKINGKVWLPSKRPKGDLPQIEGGIVERYANGGPEKNWYDLLIFAYGEKGTGFQLFLSRINSIGKFKCDKNIFIFPVDPQPDYSYCYYYENEKQFITNPKFQGEINLLKYDTISKIFSGTFNFRASSGKDTIEITDGRFDINQNEIN